MDTTLGHRTVSRSPGKASPVRAIVDRLRRWAGRGRKASSEAAETWHDTVPMVWSDTLPAGQAEGLVQPVGWQGRRQLQANDAKTR